MANQKYTEIFDFINTLGKVILFSDIINLQFVQHYHRYWSLLPLSILFRWSLECWSWAEPFPVSHFLASLLSAFYTYHAAIVLSFLLLVLLGLGLMNTEELLAESSAEGQSANLSTASLTLLAFTLLNAMTCLWKYTKWFLVAFFAVYRVLLS